MEFVDKFHVIIAISNAAWFDPYNWASYHQLLAWEDGSTWFQGLCDVEWCCEDSFLIPKKGTFARTLVRNHAHFHFASCIFWLNERYWWKIWTWWSPLWLVIMLFRWGWKRSNSYCIVAKKSFWAQFLDTAALLNSHIYIVYYGWKYLSSTFVQPVFMIFVDSQQARSKMRGLVVVSFHSRKPFIYWSLLENSSGYHFMPKQWSST